ncbi:uncharacterized protein Dvir_GJ26861 [Drosophila virilis]|uniref:Uncharacterized protein n=1 Tax=Drosophila virilis TaxID=7244 RepID=A0A0Q9WQG8_DROVI|nr:uncharacterized protein Dvir_GJ26861 [Drosophila virilis]
MLRTGVCVCVNVSEYQNNGSSSAVCCLLAVLWARPRFGLDGSTLEQELYQKKGTGTGTDTVAGAVSHINCTNSFRT